VSVARAGSSPAFGTILLIRFVSGGIALST
jgi:hypothetical protein